MKKFTFWSAIHQHTNIAFTENLTSYATGDTFWQAMQNLCENLSEWQPSTTIEETDINRRLRMFNETGINKAEIFVAGDNGRYSVKCTNSRCVVEADSDVDALLKYVISRAQTSLINTGEVNSQ